MKHYHLTEAQLRNFADSAIAHYEYVDRDRDSAVKLATNSFKTLRKHKQMMDTLEEDEKRALFT